VGCVGGAKKAALFDGFAEVAKALGSGRRAELVDVLAQGERSVEALAGEVGQSAANTSQHLQVLSRAGLVEARRDGNRVVYRLASEAVVDLWAAVRAVAAQHVAALDRLAADYLGDRTDLEELSRTQLAERLGDGVVVWDVRPTAEYVAGHVSGAVSVPPGEVRRRLRSVPKDAVVVAYCRGPYCVFADDAVRELRSRGRTALRLEDGFPEWRRAGFPVSVGDE
jgi:DNA-binding transcriptional ArsR family regulator/rhodanese-related sulfurtransferase